MILFNLQQYIKGMFVYKQFPWKDITTTSVKSTIFQYLKKGFLWKLEIYV